MNMKRMRGRNHRPNGGGGGGGSFSRNQQNGIPLNRNHVFDSSGPEMRIRGTAQQLFEKYQQMARDASGNGDRVLGEAYYQHAEHYFRIISAINQAQGQPNPPQGGQQTPQQGQDRGNYQPQQGEYQRRENTGEQQNDQPQEPRQERQDRSYEQRQRDRELRQNENRQQNEPRPQNEQRRFEPRPPRPEFQRQEPVADTRVDISSALEAELAATIPEPAGFGDQPAIEQALAAEIRPAAVIPIIPDAPPEAAPRVPRPRGRPRLIKVEAPETPEPSED
jgi:hypothetical protein